MRTFRTIARRLLDRSKVLHKLMLSRRVESSLLGLRPSFFCRLVHDTSHRRGPRPRSQSRSWRTLAFVRRTAAGIPHRIVRERPLAALLQRARIPGKYPGSQGGGCALAQSVDAAVDPGRKAD